MPDVEIVDVLQTNEKILVHGVCVVPVLLVGQLTDVRNNEVVLAPVVLCLGAAEKDLLRRTGHRLIILQLQSVGSQLQY